MLLGAVAEIDRRLEGVVIMAFAVDVDQLPVHIDIVYIQVDDFAYPQPGVQDQADNRSIAHRIESMGMGCLLIVGDVMSVPGSDIFDEFVQFLLLQQLALQLRCRILRLMYALDLDLRHDIPLQQRVKLFVLRNLAQIVKQRAKRGELADTVTRIDASLYVVK